LLNNLKPLVGELLTKFTNTTIFVSSESLDILVTANNADICELKFICNPNQPKNKKRLIGPRNLAQNNYHGVNKDASINLINHTLDYNKTYRYDYH
jgi:hypothetical protein